MDHDHLVRQAANGDVSAFVELMRRFQHSAFGSALTLVRDFQRAEDVVQEAFVAAWTALPTLEDPAAFPGWLRGIVRHHAFRLLRRKQPPSRPLTDANDIPSDEPNPERNVEQRQRAAAALAAIAELPDALREPATLFFVHECSHQDIATFLNLSVATVNNRLHAARSQLKERMLTMVTETLSSHRLPDDFANRIGRLIEARGNLVEVLFDPAATPDILAELAVSDEANRRAVNIHVVQRPAPGVVRGVAALPADALPRGSTVLNSGRHAWTPLPLAEFEAAIRTLAGEKRATEAPLRFLETGIKVIDVMCPLVAGGTVAIGGDLGAGTAVVMEELVRRLSGGSDPVTLFVMLPGPSPEWPDSMEPGFSHSEGLKREGYSEGTVGPVQTFFLRAEAGPWTDERHAVLASVDVVIRLSRERAKAKVYPTVDVLKSRSRLLEAAEPGDERAEVATRVRQALAALWSGSKPASEPERLMRERALKLQNYFTQPFGVAESYHGLPGATVGAAEALATCRDILDGRYDELPANAFYFSGGIADIQTNVGRQLRFGPVIAPAVDA